MISKTLRVVLAALVTISLFLGMRFLILPSSDHSVTESPSPTVVVTRQKRDETSKPIDPSLPEPPKKSPPPPPPKVTQDTPEISRQEGGVHYDPNAGKIEGETMMAEQDRRAIPIVTFPPEYPQREQIRGRDGWVLLEFTITTAGSVEDIVVVDAEPKNAFESASKRALQRWKYQPKLVNGKPVPQYKMQELFSFQIEAE